MESANGKKTTGKQKQKSQLVTCFYQTSKFYLKVFIFQSSFRITSKLSGRHRGFPHPLSSHTGTAWPFPTLAPDGTSVTTGEPTWTYDPPGSTVHCGCSFWGFRQIDGDIYPSWQYHPEYFPCPPNSLCSTESQSFLKYFLTVTESGDMTSYKDSQTNPRIPCLTATQLLRMWESCQENRSWSLSRRHSSSNRRPGNGMQSPEVQVGITEVRRAADWPLLSREQVGYVGSAGEGRCWNWVRELLGGVRPFPQDPVPTSWRPSQKEPNGHPAARSWWPRPVGAAGCPSTQIMVFPRK